MKMANKAFDAGGGLRAKLLLGEAQIANRDYKQATQTYRFVLDKAKRNREMRQAARDGLEAVERAKKKRRR